MAPRGVALRLRESGYDAKGVSEKNRHRTQRLSGTISTVTSETRATFANLTLTHPLQVDGHMPVPQEIVTGDGTTMAQSLSRRHVVQGDVEIGGENRDQEED